MIFFTCQRVLVLVGYHNFQCKCLERIDIFGQTDANITKDGQYEGDKQYNFLNIYSMLYKFMRNSVIFFCGCYATIDISVGLISI